MSESTNVADVERKGGLGKAWPCSLLLLRKYYYYDVRTSLQFNLQTAYVLVFYVVVNSNVLFNLITKLRLHIYYLDYLQT